MRKYDKEVLQKSLLEEKKAIRLLRKNHENAYKALIERLELYFDNSDIIYHSYIQNAIRSEINEVVENLKKENNDVIKKLKEKQYSLGFIGAMFILNRQGIPIVTKMNKKGITKTPQIKSIKGKVKTQVSQSVAASEKTQEIKNKIKNIINKDLNASVRLTRTEITRIFNAGLLDGMIKSSEDFDIPVVKQWEATLDGDTREEHAELDGQVVEVDEEFTVDRYSAQQPGEFGEPEMDFNCRCSITTKLARDMDDKELERLQNRADWYWENRGFAVGNYEHFESFYNNYVDKVL